MAREKLESALDTLFASRLSSPAFLKQCIGALKSRSEHNDTQIRAQRLTSGINALREKRARVIDGFVEGVISREERDRRLVAIDHDMEVASGMLMCSASLPTPDVGTLTNAFAPLVEWEHWTRGQKRSVLAALIPDILVADYRIEAIGIQAGVFSKESSHLDRDSWPRRA
jgi:hypothetical protein